MSWIERIEKDMIITLGDGREFRPKWLNASKSLEFNISEFEFPDVPGTLVKRAQPKGRKYNLNIFFQGEDHLDTTAAFEQSSYDPRPWQISHPFYGRLTVQPVTITIDNTQYNVSEIIIEIIETITEDNPKTTINPPDEIARKKLALDENIGESFSTDIQPTAIGISAMQSVNKSLFESSRYKIDTGIDEYFNKFNEANTFILTATEGALSAMSSLQAVINAPGLLINSLKDRINTFSEQADKLLKLINPSSRETSRIYESLGATNLSGMLQASLSEPSVLSTRNEVLSTVEEVLSKYNEFIENLDDLQSDDNGSVESFIPDVQIQMALNNMVVFTVSELFKIALNSRQERKVFVEEDTNLVLLTHRFYGLKADDSTIEEMMTINNIGLSEILQINKGREIVYYV